MISDVNDVTEPKDLGKLPETLIVLFKLIETMIPLAEQLIPVQEDVEPVHTVGDGTPLSHIQSGTPNAADKSHMT